MILDKGITIEIDEMYIYGEDIEKIKISESIDPIGAEIQIGTCDFTLKRHPEFENLFSRGKFFKVYFDGEIKTIVGVYSTNIVDEKRLEIQAEDLFGVLEDEFYYGNIAYPSVDQDTDNRPKAGDILRDIFNTAKVDYEIDSELEDIRLNGELFKVTCREALMQVCFAIGAFAFCSGQDFITVKKPNNSLTQTIERKRIKEGCKFTTNIMTKYVSLLVNYRRIWSKDSNVSVIFNYNDTWDVKAGDIREYTHDYPMGDYIMKSINQSHTTIEIKEESGIFSFIEKKPNKVIVQFLETYIGYEPTKNEYFYFETDEITKTATINLANTGSELFEIIIPYTVNIGDEWYEITHIGDFTLWDYPGSIHLPPTATTIKTNAFYNVSITNIYVPYSVKKIEQNAFSGADINRIYYESNENDWKKIDIEDGNNELKDATFLPSQESKFPMKRPFGLEGLEYEQTRSQAETKINPNAINYPYSQQALINHATLVTYDYGRDGNSPVKSGNLSEVMERVFNELTKTEQVECVIFEGKNVQEGDFVRYGQDKYGSVVYGSQRKSEITYDKPVKLGDIIGFEVNEYGYREKRLISQEYELNGNIIAKRCILR